jgi:hypothetical protein
LPNKLLIDRSGTRQQLKNCLAVAVWQAILYVRYDLTYFNGVRAIF